MNEILPYTDERVGIVVSVREGRGRRGGRCQCVGCLGVSTGCVRVEVRCQ